MKQLLPFLLVLLMLFAVGCTTSHNAADTRSESENIFFNQIGNTQQPTTTAVIDTSSGSNTTDAPATSQIAKSKHLCIITDCDTSGYDSTESYVKDKCKIAGIDFDSVSDWIIHSDIDYGYIPELVSYTASSKCTDVILNLLWYSWEDVLWLEDAYPNLNFYFDDCIGESDEYEEEEEPIISKQFTIYNILSTFNADRAWVSYYDNKDMYYGLIDPNGYLIYSIKRDSFSTNGYATGETFPDGICCLWTDPNKGREGGLLVVYSDGTLLFDGRSSNNVFYYYMGYGEGSLLVVRREADFSTNQYVFREIELGNDWWDELIIEGDKSISGDFKYLGEDIFFGYIKRGINSERYIFDRNTNVLIPCKIELWDSFQNGVIVGGNSSFANSSTSTADLYRITVEDIHQAEQIGVLKTENLTALGLSEQPYHISEGLINSKRNGAIYDYSGQVVASYPEGWQIISIDGFSGGYAAVSLKGADDRLYLTVIDTTGAPQFEPMLIDEWESPVMYHGWSSSSWHGFTLVRKDGQLRIYNPSGKWCSYNDIRAISLDYRLNLYDFGSGWRRVYNSSEGLYPYFSDDVGNYLTTVYILE